MLAATYVGGGIPVYWLVNIPDRHLEVYTADATAPAIFAETDLVDLVIAGQTVADPGRRPAPAAAWGANAMTTSPQDAVPGIPSGAVPAPGRLDPSHPPARA